MLEQSYEWLRSLNQRVKNPRLPRTERRLSDAELERVFGLIVKERLPCTVHNHYVSLGMTVYEVPPQAGYPGVEAEDLRPKALLSLSKHALPPSYERGKHVSFDRAWELFTRVSHTDENARILAACGLPEQKSKGYYEY